MVFKVEVIGPLNGRQAQVDARSEHADGYELTATPVVAFLLQYNQIISPAYT